MRHRKEREPYALHHYWHVEGLTDRQKMLNEARYLSERQPDVYHVVHTHSTGKCTPEAGCVTFILGEEQPRG